jgi:hypothetical protein
MAPPRGNPRLDYTRSKDRGDHRSGAEADRGCCRPQDGPTQSAIRKLIAAGELATIKLPAYLAIKAIIPESAVDALVVRMQGDHHQAG